MVYFPVGGSFAAGRGTLYCVRNGHKMSHVWALVIILVAFGVVGRIDYEAAIVTAQLSAERR